MLVALAGGTAAAEPFVHIQRFDDQSRVGADISYYSIDDGLLSEELTVLRFDLHAHYVHPTSGAGFYLQVPYGYAGGDNDSETALGNLEVGGILIPSALSGPTKLILHGGLTLPTAPDDNSAPVALASFSRIHDLYLAVPEGLTARVGASLLYSAGSVFVRGDLGFDVNISAAGNSDPEPAMHLNGGIGVMAGPTVAITGELSTLTVFDDNDDNSNVMNAGIGARFFAGSLQPYLGLVIPLDDEINDIMDFAVVVGLDARI